MLNWLLMPDDWWGVSHGKSVLSFWFGFFFKVLIFICAQPVLLSTLPFLMVFGMRFPTTNEENLSAEVLT